MRNLKFRRIVNVLGVFCFLCSAAFAQSTGKPEDRSPHESRFVSVGGVKLHYLDWGGTGEALVFLPGAGDTAHIYDQIAPRFTDKFRVLGLTRRGFGESDKPEKGYDVDTLTNAVLVLVDHLKLRKVHLIGHSLGGNEMFRFAIKQPGRTLKLVFLDAGYGNRSFFLDTEPRPPTPVRKSEESTLEDRIDQEYAKYGDPYDPDFRRVKAPSLSFYVMVEKHWAARPGMDESLRKKVEEWIETDVRPYQTRNIERFRREVRNSEVVVLPSTTHYFFRDPKLADDIVLKVRRFLSDPIATPSQTR
jgi:pimeloyl-ACP methyl ester carboxylesterase